MLLSKEPPAPADSQEWGCEFILCPRVSCAALWLSGSQSESIYSFINIKARQWTCLSKDLQEETSCIVCSRGQNGFTLYKDWSHQFLSLRCSTTGLTENRNYVHTHGCSLWIAAMWWRRQGRFILSEWIYQLFILEIHSFPSFPGSTHLQ